MTRKLLYIIFPLLIILVFIPRADAEHATTESAHPSGAVSTLKNQAQILKDQKKTALTQVKEEFHTVSQAAREKFKAGLETIKDQKKKLLVERIDERITQVNQDRTTKFVDVLDRLQTFVDKFNDTATGTASLADIAGAQKAIDLARVAVNTQKVKSYIITIKDDITLKVNVGTVVNQFRADLLSVYKLVTDARQAVMKLHTDKELIRKQATGSARL